MGRWGRDEGLRHRDAREGRLERRWIEKTTTRQVTSLTDSRCVVVAAAAAAAAGAAAVAAVAVRRREREAVVAVSILRGGHPRCVPNKPTC